jgi:hypothetical protein
MLGHRRAHPGDPIAKKSRGRSEVPGCPAGAKTAGAKTRGAKTRGAAARAVAQKKAAPARGKPTAGTAEVMNAQTQPDTK